MQLKNCTECGKVFVHPTRKLCNDCVNDIEKDFEKVKDFLWDKDSATIDEVHDKTGVPKKRIIKFIRNGRIMSLGLNFDFDLNCERCGKPISEGNYCQECSHELSEELNPGRKQPKPEKKKPKKDSNSKMYTADRHNK